MLNLSVIKGVRAENPGDLHYLEVGRMGFYYSVCRTGYVYTIFANESKM